ncbi:MAG: hypothetical protein N4A44_04365 [Alphaproteobacteria bacterium]|jgi:hypothetical protein|nr:hypothetical protein [Alphaproteobacteria bacterium]
MERNLNLEKEKSELAKKQKKIIDAIDHLEKYNNDKIFWRASGVDLNLREFVLSDNTLTSLSEDLELFWRERDEMLSVEDRDFLSTIPHTEPN